MSEHHASIFWERSSTSFEINSYSRDHSWGFEQNVQISASAAPEYRGSKELVNPEEAFVASLSSCHMLTFLAIASKRKFVVNSYIDNATGYLEKNVNGKLSVTRVILKPKIVFESNSCPSKEELQKLHDTSHSECFIANSVNTSIIVEVE